MSFEMVSPDNRPVTIRLKSPIRDQLSDYLEVYGSVDERGNIHCDNYTTFDASAYENFGLPALPKSHNKWSNIINVFYIDMDLYNETVQMIRQLPKHYVQV